MLAQRPIIRRNAISTDLMDISPTGAILVGIYPYRYVCPWPKNGQAKVLSNDELSEVLDAIETTGYPAKNALTIKISLSWGSAPKNWCCCVFVKSLP